MFAGRRGYAFFASREARICRPLVLTESCKFWLSKYRFFIHIYFYEQIIGGISKLNNGDVQKGCNVADAMSANALWRSLGSFSREGVTNRGATLGSGPLQCADAQPVRSHFEAVGPRNPALSAAASSLWFDVSHHLAGHAQPLSLDKRPSCTLEIERSKKMIH
jgi:hypothetical protein